MLCVHMQWDKFDRNVGDGLQATAGVEIPEGAIKSRSAKRTEKVRGAHLSCETRPRCPPVRCHGAGPVEERRSEMSGMSRRAARRLALGLALAVTVALVPVRPAA